MTELTPAFVLRILRVREGLGRNPARMLLIVRRPYAHLEDRLRGAFAGREDVAIIVDRRRGERRLNPRPVPDDRRQADRRTQKESILDVVIEGDRG
jgi:hypothetical protein